MKVALIHPQLILKGGLETRLLNYIRYFTGRGDAVTVFCYKTDASLSLPQSVTVHKMDVSLVPKPLRMYFFDRYLHSELKKEEYDFIFSLGRTSCQHALLCPGNHLGYLKAMGKRLHSPLDRLHIHMDKKAFYHSSVVLAASGMIKDELVQMYHVPPEKITIAYPPLDTQAFHVSLKKHKRELRQKFNFSENKSTFLFVSTSHDRKNFPLLEKVFASLQNEPVELAVAGFEAKTLVPTIRNLGFLSTMQEAYAAADYLIHPALYEPFGQVVSESLACGTPVIISNRTGAGEIVTEKEGFIVNEFGISDWRTAILKALQHPFAISPQFPVENGLSLEQHMKIVLGN